LDEFTDKNRADGFRSVFLTNYCYFFAKQEVDQSGVKWYNIGKESVGKHFCGGIDN